MEINYKEATFRIHKDGLIERLNKRTDTWFHAPIKMDKYGDAVTRVDYKYVKIYRIMSVFYGLSIDDKFKEISHKNKNKMDNCLDNLFIIHNN